MYISTIIKTLNIMTTVIAKLKKEYKIDTRVINNGITDGTSFWTDGNVVKVSNWITPLSVDEQERKLRWFLSHIEFDLEYS